MTKKEQYLKMVKSDCVRIGHVSDETIEFGKNIPCSNKVFMDVRYKASKIREAIADKHKLYEVQNTDYKTRQAIIRFLNCGERLDTQEAQKLITELHKSKDVYENTVLKYEAECAAWRAD